MLMTCEAIRWGSDQRSADFEIGSVRTCSASGLALWLSGYVDSWSDGGVKFKIEMGHLVG